MAYAVLHIRLLTLSTSRTVPHHEAMLVSAVRRATTDSSGDLSRVRHAARRFARVGRDEGLPPEQVLIGLRELARPGILPLMSTERRIWAIRVMRCAVREAVDTLTSKNAEEVTQCRYCRRR